MLLEGSWFPFGKAETIISATIYTVKGNILPREFFFGVFYVLLR
jgi:hypothetical protein